MRDEPVLLLEGPRSVGKSTLLQQLAARAGSTVLDLDDPATREAVASDPALFVSGDIPVFVDEYQKAPIILDAVKAQLNRRSIPGRFVLAGSTAYDTLPRAAQSLTGRLHRVPILPLTQTEIERSGTNVVEAGFGNPEALVDGRPSTTTREQYIERIVRGGFPIALARTTPAARNRWFDDYVRLTLERDAVEISHIRRSANLPRLLEKLAGQTAQILNISSAAAEINLDASTADAYTRLLEAVFLLERVPAWRSTLSARTASRPKVHVVDSGVAARLLRLSEEKLARKDPTSLTELGHLLETFVLGELQRQASWLDGISPASHWRTKVGTEVDVVFERDDGGIIAFEVKSGRRMPGSDLQPLRRLRDMLGDAFVGGFALYLGERAYTAEDRLHVLPVDRLWSAG